MDNTIDSVDGRAVGDNPQELIDQSSSSYGHTYNPPQQPIHPYPPVRYPVYSPVLYPVYSPVLYPVNSPARLPVNSPARFLVNSNARLPVNSPARLPVNSPARLPVNSPARLPVNSPARFPVNSPARFPVNSPARFPVNPPARFPANPPARFLVNPPARFPVNPPARFPVNPPARFPVNPPARFPVNSPARLPLNSPPTFPGVQLRGLPFEAKEQEIANFFRGLGIIDILTDFENEKSTGNAFCLLAHSAEVELAIQKNGRWMGSNRVEVSRATKVDYYEAIAKSVSYHLKRIPTEHTGVLRLLGLPNSVDEKEIVDFFKDFMVAEKSVNITTDSKGKQIGEAFVEFDIAGDSRAAMAKDKMLLRDHYICLFPAWYEDFEKKVLSHRVGISDVIGPEY